MKDYFFADLPSLFITEREGHKFHVEEAMIIGLTYQALGDKYSSLKTTFGGDWCAYTYPINWFIEHIFNKYYNRITGTSMEFWVEKIPDFRESIWKSIVFNQESGEQDIQMELDSFREFGWMDCVKNRTCTPGSGPINNDGDRREDAFFCNGHSTRSMGKHMDSKHKPYSSQME